MFLICTLLVVVGLAICFRGVYIHSVCKALFGALQGLVWAFITQMVLTALGVFSGIADMWLLIMGIIALISAYLACAQENIYRTIQGILYGLVTGGLIALAVYAVAFISSFSSYGSYSDINSWYPIAACLIIGFFVLLGAFKHAFFRGLGNLLMIFIVCMLIMCAYMEIAYAAIFALIIAIIGTFSINTLKEYIPILKIAAMGACIAVVGAWMLIENELLLVTIVDNASRLMSSITGYGRSGGYEMAMPVVIIGILTVVGTYSQVAFIKSISDNGEFSLALVADLWKKNRSNPGTFWKKIITGLHESTNAVNRFFNRIRPVLFRLLKIILVIAIIIALIFGAVTGVKHIIHTIKTKQAVSSVTNTGGGHVEEINSLYGKTVVQYDSVFHGDGEGERDGYEATLVNEFNGSMTVFGWYYDEDDEMFIEQIYVNVEPFENGDVSGIANLYACMMQACYGLDRYECEEIIRDELLYNDFSIPYNRVEITLGNASNIYMVMGMTENNGYGESYWYMEAGELY